MITAICLGMSPGCGISRVELTKELMIDLSFSRTFPASYRHQVGFLAGQHLVDIGDVLVGEFLDLVLGAPLLIL